MKPVNITAQTCNGECLSACIASLLELEDVPNFSDSHPVYNPHFALQRANIWLAERSLFLAENGHHANTLPENAWAITSYTGRSGREHYFVGKRSLPITFDPHGGHVNGMPVADYVAMAEWGSRRLFLAPFDPSTARRVPPMPETPIFLASPYGHSSLAVRAARAAMAAEQALKLMDEGFIVYAPICHSHPIDAIDRGRDHAFWMRQSLALLRVCGALVVADIDGWQESKGVREEVAFARSLGMPTYIGLDAFLAANKRP